MDTLNDTTSANVTAQSDRRKLSLFSSGDCVAELVAHLPQVMATQPHGLETYPRAF